MKYLTVFYDPACGLCTRVRDWLKRQAVYVPLILVAQGSPQAGLICPELKTGFYDDQLIVVSDNGSAYVGNHAWIMCLWALRDYRRLAMRLANPVLLPLARQAFEAVSGNRSRLSRLFALKTEEDMAHELGQMGQPVCEAGPLGRHDD